MTGASMIYGDSGHAGRVDVPHRAVTRLERLVLPQTDEHGEPLLVPGPPLGMVESPRGEVLVVQYMGMLVFLVPYGARTMIGAPNTLRMVRATAVGLVWGDDLHPWDPTEPTATLDGVGFLDDVGAQLGLHMDDAALTLVAQVVPSWGTARVVVRCVTHRRPGEDLHTRHRVQLGGHGTGAVDEHGRALVAMEDGAIVSYETMPAEGDDERRSRERFRLQRDPAPYAVTALSSGSVLVSAVPEYDGATNPNERQLRRLLDPRLTFHGRWHSTIERLDDAGTTQWRTTVDFPLHQPVVDGGGDRLYAVGRGLAALDGDRMAWSWPAPTRLHASAFVDGPIAVCGGPDLRVLDHDGRTVSMLSTPDGETICTPPAILGDGAIAFGTSTRLYVAR